MHLVSDRTPPVQHNIFELWMTGWRIGAVAHLYFIATASGMWWPELPPPTARLLIPYFKKARPEYLKLVVNKP